MAKAAQLTFEQVRSQLAYDPETGVITWLVSKQGGKGVGSEAGCLHQHLGYRLIGVLRKRLYAHRIAWLLAYGRWPEHQIDHINGDRADNRLRNLRECTHAQNQQNSIAKRNKHGLPGVDFDPKSKRFRSRVILNRRKHDLGYFDTAEQAHQAYIKAKRELHPFMAQ